ncbi:hypothetical protein FB451DRAFT_1500707 [Mycena latifolia]|nr:hypothetical protein FB451DRAFT_1500707 [Mycena latifolia]
MICWPAQITHVIPVMNNLTTINGTTQVVNASLGETVLFNFSKKQKQRDTPDTLPVMKGNHCATQSTFAEPCIPAHDTNSSMNGFDTNLRPAGQRHNDPGVAPLIVPILSLVPLLLHRPRPIKKK